MLASTLKVVKVEYLEEEESACNDLMVQSHCLDTQEYENNDEDKFALRQLKKEYSDEVNPEPDFMYRNETVFFYSPNHLNSKEYVNYFDNKEILQPLKEELSKEECPRPSIINKIIFEDDKELKLIDKQESACNGEDEELILPIKKEEEGDNKYQDKIKPQSSDDQGVSHKHDNTSVPYDVLVPNEDILCKFCGIIIQNGSRKMADTVLEEDNVIDYREPVTSHYSNCDDCLRFMENGLSDDFTCPEDRTQHSSSKCTINRQHFEQLIENNYFCPWYIDHSLFPPPSSRRKSSTGDVLNMPKGKASPSAKRRRRKRRSPTVKRKRNEHTEKMIRERTMLRDSGKEYVAHDGTLRRAKTLKPICKEKCKYKCAMKISHEARLRIFNEFWGMGNRDKQLDFIANLVVKHKKLKELYYPVSKRTFSITYLLPNERNKIRTVCKKMFMNTFSIGERFLYISLKKKEDGRSDVVNVDDFKRVCTYIKTHQSVESENTSPKRLLLLGVVPR